MAETVVGSPLRAGYSRVQGRKNALGDRVVEDPVTGAEITVKDADYCTVYDESIYYFESESTRATFLDAPEAHL